MEKLQKINKILFTIMSILVIIVIVFALVSLIISIFFREEKLQEDKIMSQKEVEELLKQDKRAQLISYTEIQPIRGTDYLFIIAVSQTTLDRPQRISRQWRDEDPPMKTYPSYKSLSSSFGFYKGNRALNNLLVYSSINNSAVPIFKERVCIIDFINYTIDDKIYIYIIVSINDSNKDGVLDHTDLKDIFVYDIFEKALKKITQKCEFILSSERLGISDNILVKIGTDRNSDNKFDYDYEPVNMRVFNVVTHEYKDFIDPQTHQLLQDILDGKAVE